MKFFSLFVSFSYYFFFNLKVLKNVEIGSYCIDVGFEVVVVVIMYGL